ncbi:hypothetical protein CAC42_7448 [Sphaceloma murrayae]|uniref:Uncharacterized protein n=1 Tax=Sphaceloma murrayae TaxID=2082308 RepID=A0A2K1QX26_9PEZI|nr:hypothetical protein CAC42_7448 [Sphaceloma murrayae]
MPHHSRVTNAANRKLIISALFTAKYGAYPISITCSHRVSVTPGTTVKCERTLDADSLLSAINTVEKIHSCIPAGEGLEFLSRFGWKEFVDRLTYVATCMFCDEHRTSFAVTDLTDRYIVSLRLSAQREYESAEDLLGRIRTAQFYPVKEDIYRLKRAQDQQKPAGGNTYPSYNGQQQSRSGTHHQQSQGRDPNSHHDESSTPKKPHGREVFGKQYDQHYPGYQSDRASSPIIEPTDKWPGVVTMYRRFWSLDKYTDPNQDKDASKDVSLLFRLYFPVESGQYYDVEDAAVKTFYEKATLYWGGNVLETLKTERTKWHPDKIDQRFAGHRDLNRAKECANVVFRVLNTMFNEERQKQKQTGAGHRSPE